MNIQGFNKVTLLDYPGLTACTVFTGGCDLRCPFCHNSPLVLDPRGAEGYTVEEVLEHLKKRKGILDGIAVSGGEPLLQPDLEDFLRKICDIGDYKIKLDTNGTHPERLASIISEGLCDKVAMDIKNSPEKYAQTVGVRNFDVELIRASLSFIMLSGIDYELRTTLVRELHDADSMRGIAEFIRGAKAYYLQNFVDSGALIGEGMSGFDENQMQRFADIVRDSVESVELRGI
jgi:pyruvate formate lyase activating enzyme